MKKIRFQFIQVSHNLITLLMNSESIISIYKTKTNVQVRIICQKVFYILEIWIIGNEPLISYFISSGVTLSAPSLIFTKHRCSGYAGKYIINPYRQIPETISKKRAVTQGISRKLFTDFAMLGRDSVDFPETIFRYIS